MNLLFILRFIRGYVIFEIKGGFVERFINLCAANNIHIWDVSVKKDSLTAGILVKNFKNLRPILRKSGCQLKIQQKKGIPVFMKKNRSRVGLLISSIFFIYFIIFMNQFVWIIEVKGTNTVSHEEIINVAEELGLNIGSFASSVDTLKISRQAINHFNGDLMWMAINIKGSKAVIEVRDYVDEHEDTEFKDPCNLIADFDGTLLSVEVYHGDQEAWVGNAVKKGDLLISGVIENRDLSCVYYEARGKITALHDVYESYQYPNSETQYMKSEETKNVYSLKFLGLTIPLGYVDKSEYPAVNEYDKYISLESYKLPFGISKRTYSITSEVKKKNGSDLLFALDEFTSSFYEVYKNTNIISDESFISNEDNSYIIQSNLKCIDFMGEQSPILTEFYVN